MSYLSVGGVFDVGLQSGKEPTYSAPSQTSEEIAAAKAAAEAAARAAADKAVAARLAEGPTYNIWQAWLSHVPGKPSLPVVPIVVAVVLGYVWWRSV